MSDYADLLRVNGEHVLYKDKVYRIDVHLGRTPFIESQHVVPTEATRMMGRAVSKKVRKLLRSSKKGPEPLLSVLALLLPSGAELSVACADVWMNVCVMM